MTWVLSHNPPPTRFSLSPPPHCHGLVSSCWLLQWICISRQKSFSYFSLATRLSLFISLSLSSFSLLMESGNSGSIQSSSTGGDEESYDSRSESISAFLNNPPTTHLPHMAMANPPTHSSSSMFDPFSNFFEHPLSSTTRPTNPNSLLHNLDMPAWSRPTSRSDPNSSDLARLIQNRNQPNFVTGQLGGQNRVGACNFQGVSDHQVIPENNASGGSVSSSTVPADQTNNNMNMNNINGVGTTTTVVRNSKKRTRASRRAPTTVLTTDTTNFRAMVQEFTGIPAPPFTSSPFPRTRLDLFSTGASNLRSGHFDPNIPSYLLRPFPQKAPFISPPPPPTSASSSSSFPTSSVADTLAHDSNTNAFQNLLGMNMQSNNPIFNFQDPAKYNINPLSNSSISGSKSLDQISQTDPHLKMGLLEEFGLSHGHASTTQLTGLHNIVSSGGTTLSLRDNNSNTLTNWGTVGAGSHDQGLMLMSINGSNYSNSERVTSGKMSYSSSSSDLLGEKRPENNVTARSEGMVESWICSSD